MTNYLLQADMDEDDEYEDDEYEEIEDYEEFPFGVRDFVALRHLLHTIKAGIFTIGIKTVKRFICITMMTWRIRSLSVILFNAFLRNCPTRLHR
ncbi:MAG: hypothetical protein K0Q90_3286 [Paenibacillaceae bacterium]|jgi:hypothetical protein|nr:hypothetical protein [Paenibacillaceae bacterium]